jgi:dephospho-CoA kinase
MLRVGLTGGYASGKSFVGGAMAGFGCHLIEADCLGHEVLKPGGEAYAGVLGEFGTGILDPGGHIDRRRLGAEVFDQPDRLAALNALVHPHVIRREEEQMRALAAADPHGIVLVAAAILIETGNWQRFDRILVVVCAEEQQITRAMARDGLGREQVVARLKRQMPLDEKRKFAHYIIDTSGTKEETLRQSRRVYEELKRTAS